MSVRREHAATVGVGVAACAVCCAGPIFGVLAAVGLGTAAGVALLGAVALVLTALVIAIVLVLRRRRAATCAATGTDAPVRVDLTRTRVRS